MTKIRKSPQTLVFRVPTAAALRRPRKFKLRFVKESSVLKMTAAQKRRGIEALAKNAATWLKGLMEPPSQRDTFMPILSRTVLVGDKRLAELDACGYVRLRGMCPLNEATHDEVHALVREVIRWRSGRTVHGPRHLTIQSPGARLKRHRKKAKP